MDIAAPVIIDTAFRSALRRLQAADRVQVITEPVNPDYEVAAAMRKLDGGPAVLFTGVTGHAVPVLGNFLASRENCEAAFGMDYRGIREFVGRAISNPMPPVPHY